MIARDHLPALIVGFGERQLGHSTDQCRCGELVHLVVLVRSTGRRRPAEGELVGDPGRGVDPRSRKCRERGVVGRGRQCAGQRLLRGCAERRVRDDPGVGWYREAARRGRRRRRWVDRHLDRDHDPAPRQRRLLVERVAGADVADRAAAAAATTRFVVRRGRRPEDAVADRPVTRPARRHRFGIRPVCHQRGRDRAARATGEWCVLVVAIHIEADAEVAVGHAGGPRAALGVRRISEVATERPGGGWRCRVRRIGCREGEHHAIGAGAIELIGVEGDVQSLGGRQARLVEHGTDLAAGVGGQPQRAAARRIRRRCAVRDRCDRRRRTRRQAREVGTAPAGWEDPLPGGGRVVGERLALEGRARGQGLGREERDQRGARRHQAHRRPKPPCPGASGRNMWVSVAHKGSRSDRRGHDDRKRKPVRVKAL